MEPSESGPPRHERPGVRGASRIRTGVQGFAGPCLTTRPSRHAPESSQKFRTALNVSRACAQVPQIPLRNRCTRLCRPLPNHSATAPRAKSSYRANFSLERIGSSCAECRYARRREPCPGVDSASACGSPGPLPGLHLVRSSIQVAAGRADSLGRRKRARNVRRSSRRASPIRAPSSPARASRSRSE
jgi:hypothetical protein